ncbi:hypothetical protein FB451DRAFT_1399494 [Mycena latifolia]|nr:hypothetical protein FB451DRAFT_1399494 [Mycena latifolia]
MSASTKASCFIGIHKAPSTLSWTEFEAKVNALGDAIAKLPVAQQNLLKLVIISQNTLMDQHMKALGLPVPAPTVVMSAEYESLEHLAGMLKDPALQKLLANADTFGFRKGATAFAADVVTKVDADAPTTPCTNPVRHCFLSYSLWTQNDAVDKQLQALGYPMPEPLVVVRADAEIVEHSEVARLVAEGMREFGFHQDTANPAESCCFSADVSTKINNYKA